MRIILASLILSVLYTGAALAQVYVANNGSDNVSVISISDGSTVTVDLPTGSAPIGIAVTPDGEFVYVANFGNDNVSVIRTSDNTVIDTVDVGVDPAGVAIPNDTSVFVANSNSDTVSVIQTSDNTVVDTVAVGEVPTGVAATSDGDFVYVSNNAQDTISVIQTSDNTVVSTGAGDSPVGIASGDAPGEQGGGAAMFVANQGSNTVSVILVPSNIVIDEIDVGDAPTGIAVTPDGISVYVANLNSNTLMELQSPDGGAAGI